MRRAASIILFVLGGWFLSSEVMVSWMALPGTTLAPRLFALGFMALLAAPLLALGTWASPGNRLAELGLTLMIVAGIGGAFVLVLLMVLNDPGFRQVMPPDQPMPNIHLEPVGGLLNLAVLAGVGFLLRRLAIARARQAKPDLEQVFD